MGEYDTSAHIRQGYFTGIAPVPVQWALDVTITSLLRQNYVVLIY